MHLLFKEYYVTSTSISLLGDTSNKMRDVLEEFDNQSGCGKNKPQLHLYLEDPNLDHKVNSHLDVLVIEKKNRLRYPKLSARDVLSIVITILVSGSSFSIRGRTLEKFKSSVLPANAKSKLCTRVWLRGQKGKSFHAYYIFALFCLKLQRFSSK